MRKLITAVNITLDGCVDHRAGNADDELLDFYIRQLDALDGILFGRVTFQLFEDYWPTAYRDPRNSRGVVEYSKKINGMQKLVLSSSLPGSKWENTRIIRGDVVEEARKLKNQSGKPFSVGGITLIQTLLQEGLIDEYWHVVHPVVWGAGIRLFDAMHKKSKMELVDAQNFKSGVIALHYINEKQDT